MSVESSPPNSAPRSRSWWLLTVPLLWALVIFVKYFHFLNLYLPNGPLLFSGARWTAPALSIRLGIWLESLWIFLCAAALVGITLSLGSRLRRWLGLSIAEAWVRVSFNFGLGFLGLDFFWLGTGLTHLWWTPLLAVFLAGAFALALWDAAHWAAPGAFSIRSFWPQDHRWLMAIAGLYFLLVLGHEAAPETFYDSMVYHLAIPSDWLLAHGIVNCPTNFFSNYPYGAELFFLNGFFVQGTEAAKCLHAAAFFFCGLLAGGWAREKAGPDAGWLTMGMILTLPLLALNASTTQVEGVLAFFTVLFLYAFWKAFETTHRDRRWFWTAGLLAGAALAVKYTAAVGLFCAALSLGWGVFRKSRFSDWICLGAAALAVLGPWLLKNFCYTGNPLFPYAAHWLGGQSLAPAGYARLLAEQRAFNGGSGWSWLTLPWRLIMSNPDGYNFAGPLALAVAPFLFLRRFQNPVLGFWARTSLLYFGVGLCVTHILRFMAPSFIVFYLLAGTSFAGAGKTWARGFSWAAALTAFLCFFYLASISVFYYACEGIWWGKETRAAYLMGQGKITPYASMAQWISASLPKDAKLLVVGDARGLYYQRPFLTNSVFDTQVLAQAAEKQKDAQGIVLALRKLGATHLVVNGPEGLRVAADYHHYDLSPEAWARLDAFFKTQTTLLYDRNFQSVYALRAPSVISGEPMPLIFFTAPGKSFIQDYQRQNWAGVDLDLDQALALYPGCVFWREQKAVAAFHLGKERESESLFEEAGRMGPLSPEGYQAWAETAENLGLTARRGWVLAAAKKLYPGQF